jgi:hemerythrin-like metal-binding protein
MRMALLQWNSNYSVGVDSMDRQHRKLFEILNELHAAMMKGEAQKITGELLRKLVAYTREHFTAEEALMATAGYSALAQHRIKHRDLIKQVDDLAARYERGENNLNLPLLNFLRDWLTNHIQQEDKLYGPSLNKPKAY